MNKSEYTALVRQLSTFGESKENSFGVGTRLGVQWMAGSLALITGSELGTCVVRCDKASVRGPSHDLSYHVDFRPFAQSVKAITGRVDITFEVTEDALIVHTTAGGKLRLKKQGPLADAGFLRKPRDMEISFEIPSIDTLSAMAEGVFKTKEKLEHTYGTIVDDAIIFVEPKGHTKYACLRVRNMNSRPLIVRDSFWAAIKGLKKGRISAGPHGIMAVTDTSSVYHKVEHVSEQWDPWPLLDVSGEFAEVIVDRKAAIAAFKAMLPREEYQRVNISFADGKLHVSPYGSDDEQVIPAKRTRGTGQRLVNAQLLIDMFSNMDPARDVAIRLTTAPAVVLAGDGFEDWTLMIAPTVLS